MNAEQLRLLAPRVRELLAGRLATIPHGQALDLTAALVGVRNWPEVLAFPEKVAAREIDLAAAERLIEHVCRKGSAAARSDSMASSDLAARLRLPRTAAVAWRWVVRRP